MGSKPISASCPRGGRPLVEDAASLRVSDLRSRWGWLRSLDVVALDGSVVKLSLNVGEADTFAWVHTEWWPAGGRWAHLTYDVEIVSRPARLGGSRWFLRCPETGALVTALYLSLDGSRLASRGALGLAHRSQRQRAPARAADRAQRLAADLGASGLGAVPVRPRGMWSRTFARRSAELARLVKVAVRVPRMQDRRADVQP